MPQKKKIQSQQQKKPTYPLTPQTPESNKLNKIPSIGKAAEADRVKADRVKQVDRISSANRIRRVNSGGKTPVKDSRKTSQETFTDILAGVSEKIYLDALKKYFQNGLEKTLEKGFGDIVETIFKKDLKEALERASEGTLSGLGELSSEIRLIPRPERLNYVRGKKSSLSCVFCLASEKTPSFKSLCVFRSSHSMVVLNKYPYNSGHLLVIPRLHKGTLSELDDQAYLDLMMTLKKTEQVLRAVYNPDGMNIGLNQGKASGAGIPDHLHFHVIPRWSGDLNFFPLIAKSKILVEDVSVTYKKVAAAFKKI
jgi:ATP adenylyltransferase